MKETWPNSSISNIKSIVSTWHDVQTPLEHLLLHAKTHFSSVMCTQSMVATTAAAHSCNLALFTENELHPPAPPRFSQSAS